MLLTQPVLIDFFSKRPLVSVLCKFIKRFAYKFSTEFYLFADLRESNRGPGLCGVMININLYILIE